MNPTKIVGIVLIVAGCLGLAYGGFTYTKETSAVKLGPIELKVQEKETVSVPLIVSAGAIAIGVFLLVTVGRK
jgi:multidrug transporter EmrE-like cation transporter